MRILMIVTSIVSYWINKVITDAHAAGRKRFDFENL